jgi:hypothetical protein
MSVVQLRSTDVIEKAEFYLAQLQSFIALYPTIDASVLAEAEAQLAIHQDIVASLQQMVEPTVDGETIELDVTEVATSTATTTDSETTVVDDVVEEIVE